MKFFAFLISACGFWVLSGCAVQNPVSYFFSDAVYQKEVVVSLKGVIKKQDTFFGSYVFISDNAQIFQLDTVDGFSKDLSLFKDKNVVVKGIISDFVKDEVTGKISFESHLDIIDITLFREDSESGDTWNVFIPEYFDIKFSAPLSVRIEEKKLQNENLSSPQSRIIAKYNNDFFFNIAGNIDEGWVKKFTEKGDIVVIGDIQAYRLFSGEQILFYVPSLQIQIDYWGDLQNIHLFYGILKTIGEYKYDAKKEVKIVEKTYTNSISLYPNEILVLDKILNNKNEILEEKSDNEFILLDNIEFFGKYCAVEYRIIGSNSTDSVLDALFKKKLFAIEWKDNSVNEFYVQRITEWKRGEYNVWEIVTGNVPDLGEYKYYFLRNINTKFIMLLPKDFLMFFSPEYKYSVGYPQKMYYEVLKNNDTIETVIWSYSPYNSLENFDIKLSLKSEGIDEYNEDFSNNIIFIPKSDSAHFALEGSSNIKFSFLKKMAESIVLY